MDTFHLLVRGNLHALQRSPQHAPACRSNAMPPTPLVACGPVRLGALKHAILHLLYSGFFTKGVRDRGCSGFDDPSSACLTPGMGAGHHYKKRRPGKYVASGPADVGEVRPIPASD